jgi:hypothetical protein
MTLVATGTTTHVTNLLPGVSTDTSINYAGANTAKEIAIERSHLLNQCGVHPRYAQDLIWGDVKDIVSPAAHYSLFADPLPCPPLSAFRNTAATETINNHPKLFKITCNINVNVFQSLLWCSPLSHCYICIVAVHHSHNGQFEVTDEFFLQMIQLISLVLWDLSKQYILIIQKTLSLLMCRLY